MRSHGRHGRSVCPVFESLVNVRLLRRLREVFFSRKDQLYLVFDYVELDLRRYIDGSSPLTPRIVKVSCVALRVDDFSQPSPASSSFGSVLRCCACCACCA